MMLCHIQKGVEQSWCCHTSQSSMPKNAGTGECGDSTSTRDDALFSASNKCFLGLMALTPPCDKLSLDKVAIQVHHRGPGYILPQQSSYKFTRGGISTTSDSISRRANGHQRSVVQIGKHTVILSRYRRMWSSSKAIRGQGGLAHNRNFLNSRAGIAKKSTPQAHGWVVRLMNRSQRRLVAVAKQSSVGRTRSFRSSSRNPS